MMDIESGRTYQIIGDSPYFKGKYGRMPTIWIEGTDYDVWGKSFLEMDGNITALLYLKRGLAELTLSALFGGTVYYGKVDGLGELVHESELGEE